MWRRKVYFLWRRKKRKIKRRKIFGEGKYMLFRRRRKKRQIVREGKGVKIFGKGK